MCQRNGFDDRIAFDVANLPHGVIVDDIGLSGVLIPEKQTERTIFLRAEPWVPEQTRPFFATAQVEGNQSRCRWCCSMSGNRRGQTFLSATV